MSPSRKRPNARRTARFCGPLAAAVALGAFAAAPAQATVVGGSIEADENITVFHNIDFIAAFGVGSLGQQVKVDVLRDGAIIGSSTGPLADTPEGPGLEVNHGVEGNAGPGDCWVGYTPNIGPRDHVRVTNLVTGDVDEVIVDDITFDPAGPVEEIGTGRILVHGVAKRADGANIAPGFIDSGEFRAGAYRGGPNQVVARAGVDGGFTMIYNPPYNLVEGRNDGGLNEAQRKAALLGDGHATGFGHVVPLPRESMLVDGIEDVPGPAIGCAASGARVNGAIALPSSINAATTAIELSGVKQASVSGVQISITDGAPGTTPVVVDGANAGTTSWSVALTPEEIAAVKALQDGTLTATATFAGATAEGSSVLQIAKDVVAPVVSGSLAAGSYEGERSLALAAGLFETVEFSLDGGTTWSQYFGELLLPVGTTSVTVRARDAVGNVSVPVTWTYVISERSVLVQEVVKGSAPQAQQSAPPAPPAPVVNQDASVRNLVVSSFRLASSTSLSAARTKGVEVAYQVPAGADSVTFAVYGTGARAAARKAVVKRTVRVSGSGRRTIRIRSAKFKAGRYTLEITPSRGGSKGATVKRSFKIRK